MKMVKMDIPKLNTVVIFTGANYITRLPAFNILKKYITPAIEN